MILSSQSDQMVFVQANNLVHDSYCIFEIMGSDYKAVLPQRDIIPGFYMNSNFLICDAPDYTGMGSVQVQLKIGYGTDPLKTQSKSSVTINFVDRCPPGYACED